MSDEKRFTRMSRREIAVAFLRDVVAGKIHQAYQDYVSPVMRHHNAYSAGDSVSLEKAMQENHLQFPHKFIDIKHVIEEGEFIAVHSHVRLEESSAGIVTVHIFRFEGSLIVELWDIGQAVPENSPNMNGVF